MTVSLIIPTYQEAQNIPLLFARLQEVATTLAAQGVELTVCIVDDASPDDTAVIARKQTVSFPVQVIERTARGLATAVLHGIAHTDGEIFAVMDADLSHPPEVLLQLVAAMQQGAGCAIASRHVTGGGVETWPWHRRVLSGMGALWARLLAHGVRDPLSGFFLCRRTLLHTEHLSPIGYKILLEILVKDRPQPVVEIPYLFTNRSVGKSKMDIAEGLRYLRHCLRLTLWRLHHRGKEAIL